MTKKTAGRDGVVVTFTDAERRLERKRKRRVDPALDPPPEMARGPNLDIYPNRKNEPPNWTPDRLGLPTEEPCPVEPVGFNGPLSYVIDSARQFCEVESFSHEVIQRLFGLRPNYVKWAWPRYGKPRKAKEGEAKPKAPIESFSDDHVREALIRACQIEGLFSPADKMRGRGAWSLLGGQILYHAGESIWMCETDKLGVPRFREYDTGFLALDGERHLYPRLAPLPEPWTEPVTPATNPAGQLLETFRKWNWERPKVDPVLLLGWCGVAYLGGALDWRPAMLLLGGYGTGKSELQKGLQALFGEHLMPSSDTTGPAIAQTLKQDTRAVACDELEPDADTRKVDAVVALMRAAASGDFRRRGSSDQKAIETHLRSAFLFSAINNPIQRSQDLSRVAILRLRELRQDQTKPPAIDADTCGRKVLARMMAEWPKFEAIREAFMAALAGGGHVPRGQKTYGTLLACAEMMLGPELADELGVALSDDPGFWRDELNAEKLPETEDAMQNWRACIKWLLNAPVPFWRNGARQSVGQLLGELEDGGDGSVSFDQAQRELAMTGLGLLRAGSVHGLLLIDGHVLAVPNSHPQVAELFRGTQWAGSPGAGGPWKDAMRQAPPEIVVTRKDVNRVRIAGSQERCSLVVLRRFHGAAER